MRRQRRHAREAAGWVGLVRGVGVVAGCEDLPPIRYVTEEAIIGTDFEEVVLTAETYKVVAATLELREEVTVGVAAHRRSEIAMMQTGHGERFGSRAASRWARTSGVCSKAARRRARHSALVPTTHRRREPRVSVVGTMQARRPRLLHRSPRPLFHDRSVLRGLTGLALGLGLSLSCGGNKGGGGGTGGCRNTADLCENCLPGQCLHMRHLITK